MSRVFFQGSKNMPPDQDAVPCRLPACRPVRSVPARAAESNRGFSVPSAGCDSIAKLPGPGVGEVSGLFLFLFQKLRNWAGPLVGEGEGWEIYEGVRRWGRGWLQLLLLLPASHGFHHSSLSASPEG